jgi:membrane protease YdiL (CAAX protease family)
MHLDPVQGTVAFAAGLFLGWVVERLEGIRPTVAAHLANNALSVAVLRFFGGPASPSVQGLRMAAGCVALAGSIALLRSHRAVRVSGSGPRNAN